jgi:hypothetical protein
VELKTIIDPNDVNASNRDLLYQGSAIRDIKYKDPKKRGNFKYTIKRAIQNSDKIDVVLSSSMVSGSLTGFVLIGELFEGCNMGQFKCTRN